MLLNSKKSIINFDQIPFKELDSFPFGCDFIKMGKHGKHFYIPIQTETVLILGNSPVLIDWSELMKFYIEEGTMRIVQDASFVNIKTSEIEVNFKWDDLGHVSHWTENSSIIFIQFAVQIQTKEMDIKAETKTSLANVMMRNNFYHRSMTQIKEILNLLEMPIVEDANSILQYTKMGLLRLYEQYFQTDQKQRLLSHLYEKEKFNSISRGMKDYLVNLLNHTHKEVTAKLEQQKSVMQQMMYMSSHPLQSSGFQPSVYSPYSYQVSEVSGVPSSYVPLDAIHKRPTQELRKYYEQLYPSTYRKSSVQPLLNHEPSVQSNNRRPTANQGMLHQQPFSSAGSASSNPYMRNSLPPNFSYGQNYPFNANMYNPYLGSQYPVSYHSLPHHIGTPNPYFNQNTIRPNYQIPKPENLTQNKPSNNGDSNYHPNFNVYKGNSSEIISIENKQSPTRRSQSVEWAEKTLIDETPQRKNNSESKSISSLNAPNPSLSIQSSQIQPKATTNSTFYRQKSVTTEHTTLNSSPIVEQQQRQVINSKPLNVVLPKEIPFKDVNLLKEPNPDFKCCSCQGFYDCKDKFECSECKKNYHFKCLRMSVRVSSNEVLVCPHCKLREIDPLNMVCEVLGEYHLNNLLESNFQATLDFTKYLKYFKKASNKYEIEMRCLRSGDHGTNPEISWPDELLIQINKEMHIKLAALQANSSVKKRKDFPFFLTSELFMGLVNLANENSAEFLKLKATRIRIGLMYNRPEEVSHKKVNNCHNFSMGIYLTEKLNADELYAKVMSEEHSRNDTFAQNLMNNTEAGVEIDKITIKLTDPFSWEVIRTPVRGWKCGHTQCFDLKTFISLMYSAKDRNWRCPLCSKDSRKLMIDDEQTELIAKAHEYSKIPKEIEIFRNGQRVFKVDRESDSEEEENVSNQIGKTKKIQKAKRPHVDSAKI